MNNERVAIEGKVIYPFAAVQVSRRVVEDKDTWFDSRFVSPSLDRGARLAIRSASARPPNWRNSVHVPDRTDQGLPPHAYTNAWDQ